MVTLLCRHKDSNFFYNKKEVFIFIPASQWCLQLSVLFEHSCTSSLSDTKIHLCWQVQSGKYFLVDLTTATDPYVATVPDFWVNEGHSAGILRHLGRGLQWSVKLHSQIGFFISVWSGEHLVCFIAVLLLLLYCSSYSQHIYFADSPGHRNKRPRKRFTVDESHVPAVVQVLSESTGPLNLTLLLFLQNCLKMLFEQPDKLFMYPGSSFNRTQNTVSRIVSILSCLYRQFLTTHDLQ